MFSLPFRVVEVFGGLARLFCDLELSPFTCVLMVASSSITSDLPYSAFFFAPCDAVGGSASSEDEQPSSESPSPSF